MRISDWSSDVCSSDLVGLRIGVDLEIGLAEVRDARFQPRDRHARDRAAPVHGEAVADEAHVAIEMVRCRPVGLELHHRPVQSPVRLEQALRRLAALRSEEHTSELQSLMRISYAVFCLKKKKTHTNN